MYHSCQSFHANAGIVPSIRPWLLPSTSFPFTSYYNHTSYWCYINTAADKVSSAMSNCHFIWYISFSIQLCFFLPAYLLGSRATSSTKFFTKITTRTLQYYLLPSAVYMARKCPELAAISDRNSLLVPCAPIPVGAARLFPPSEISSLWYTISSWAQSK
jgi:hypothetical protein